MLSEDDLCQAFADQIKESPAFVTWLLGRTKKFSGLRADDVRVLWEEQQEQRTSLAAPWWRHWWMGKCKCTGCIGGRETDIFVVFELIESNDRFALHIENKPPKKRFTKGQAAAYPIRAKCWAHQKRFLNYTDYEAILVAPLVFLSSPGAELFTGVSYEDVAKVLSCYDVSQTFPEPEGIVPEPLSSKRIGPPA
jgi:hypothetical protein